MFMTLVFWKIETPAWSRSIKFGWRLLYVFPYFGRSFCINSSLRRLETSCLNAGTNIFAGSHLQPYLKTSNRLTLTSQVVDSRFLKNWNPHIITFDKIRLIYHFIYFGRKISINSSLRRPDTFCLKAVTNILEGSLLQTCLDRYNRVTFTS